jgi:hypothetical protein
MLGSVALVTALFLFVVAAAACFAVLLFFYAFSD